MGSRPRLALGLLASLFVACGTDNGGFIGVRSHNLCDGTYPICNTAAGCVLDDSQYTDGTFPGDKRLIFRTQGAAQVRVRLLFTQELSAGNATVIEWNELGCGSQQLYSTMGQDVFQLAGDAQQIVAAKTLQTQGNHLIRISSDATALYQLRVEIAQ